MRCILYFSTHKLQYSPHFCASMLLWLPKLPVLANFYSSKYFSKRNNENFFIFRYVKVENVLIIFLLALCVLIN